MDGIVSIDQKKYPWLQDNLYDVMIEALFQQGLLSEQQCADVRVILHIGNMENQREE